MLARTNDRVLSLPPPPCSPTAAGASSDLEKRIASGALKLVEEKRATDEITKLKRAKGGAETLQKKGAEAAAAAATPPSAKELQLDQAHAELDEVKKALSGLQAARASKFGTGGAFFCVLGSTA